MRIIEPSAEILALQDSEQVLSLIEKAGRTCYKSEHRIAQGSAQEFIARIIDLGHESVLEHASATVRFIVDRGVSHELVRHRLASFSQESTRYANYAKERFGKEITVIRPCFWAPGSPGYLRWEAAMQAAEQHYLALINSGAKAQEARSVLPNSLKTEVVMTANLRQWRHVFQLRCAAPAHPQIRQVMLPLLAQVGQRLPVLFSDLLESFSEEIQSEA
jgi:thymidylate synthase (FAD)